MTKTANTVNWRYDWRALSWAYSLWSLGDERARGAWELRYENPGDPYTHKRVASALGVSVWTVGQIDRRNRDRLTARLVGARRGAVLELAAAVADLRALGPERVAVALDMLMEGKTR